MAEHLARILNLVRSVWQSDEDAARFLNTPHPELGDVKPIERATSAAGARAVEEIIERAKNGFPV